MYLTKFCITDENISILFTSVYCGVLTVYWCCGAVAVLKQNSCCSLHCSKVFHSLLTLRSHEKIFPYKSTNLLSLINIKLQRSFTFKGF